MTSLEGELRVLGLTLFFAGVWWSWRHQNLMCLGGETKSLQRLTCNIKNSIESIVINFSPYASVVKADRYIRWINNNFSGVILNVDGSCHGTPVRTGFGGVLPNDTCLFLAGFSGFIPGLDDILLGELSAIYHGLIMAKDLGYAELACYSDSLACINLINGPIDGYHIYDVLIQDIKQMLQQTNIMVSHTFREGNHCADYTAKLEASSDVKLLHHNVPPTGLVNLLSSDATDTLFLRE